MNTASDFVVYSLVVAGIFVMTAPNSKGPQLVNSLTSGYAKIVNAVTGR